jgi:hypothetical protein
MVYLNLSIHQYLGNQKGDKINPPRRFRMSGLAQRIDCTNLFREGNKSLWRFNECEPNLDVPLRARCLGLSSGRSFRVAF